MVVSMVVGGSEGVVMEVGVRVVMAGGMVLVVKLVVVMVAGGCRI